MNPSNEIMPAEIMSAPNSTPNASTEASEATSAKNPTKPSAKHVNFTSLSEDPFSVELNQRKQEFIQSLKTSSKGGALVYIKAISYYLILGGLLATLLMVPLSGIAALGICAFAGFIVAAIGFNVGHDALHGAFSPNKTINTLAGHSFTMNGANTHNWIILHNHIHHNYTNLVEADGDLAPVPLLRFHPSTEGLKPYHRFQHLYAPFLYALTSLVWVLKKDYDHINKKSHMGYVKPPLPKGEFGRMIIFKALYYFAFLIAPMIWSSYSIGAVLLGFCVMHFAQGLTLALVFQLGHIVEGPETSHVPKDGQVVSWHRLQMLGTCNFCSESKIANWIFGGLNQQIEHHLFPMINHTHYPALSRIVKEVAEKHNVPYFEKKSYWSALVSHFRVLKACGNPELFSTISSRHQTQPTV